MQGGQVCLITEPIPRLPDEQIDAIPLFMRASACHSPFRSFGQPGRIELTPLYSPAAAPQMAS